MKAASSVLALALLVAFAHCGDAAAADAPVSEAGGANRHPNEPGGFTKLADTSFGRMTESGFIVSRRNKLGSIVQDATAPRSPGNVYRMTYTKGKHDGEGGVNRLWSPSIREGARRMYVHTWWKLSKNWIGHPSGVNKVFYLSDRKHSVIVAIAGGGRGPLGVRVIPQGSLKSDSFRAPDVIKRGKWHEWELLLEAPGQGRPNVQLDIWIDGKKVLEVEMQPRDPSLGLRWTHLNLDPIWGGRHGELPEEQYQYCDHMYISYSKSGSSSPGGGVPGNRPAPISRCSHRTGLPLLHHFSALETLSLFSARPWPHPDRAVFGQCSSGSCRRPSPAWGLAVRPRRPARARFVSLRHRNL